MNFSDHKIREQLESTYVIRTQVEMEASEEYNSTLWSLVSRYISDNKHLYKVPVRDVKTGESIYNKNASYIAYRVD